MSVPEGGPAERRQAETVRQPSRVDEATGDRIDRGERLIEPRSWWDRTSDELTSWFGNAQAAGRRQLDTAAGDHRGQGPKTYKRADQTILEEVSQLLSDSHDLDASGIVITVHDGEAKLDGQVRIRADKHLAEDIAESVAGVAHVQNNLRVGMGV